MTNTYTAEQIEAIATDITPLEDTMTTDPMISALDARGIDTTQITTTPDGVHRLGRVAVAEDGTLDDGTTAYTYTVYGDGNEVLTTDGGGLDSTADQIAWWLSQR